MNAAPSVGDGVSEEEEEEDEAVEVARMSNLDAFSNGGESNPEQPSELTLPMPLPPLLESAASDEEEEEELLALRVLYPLGGFPPNRDGGGGCRRGGSEGAAVRLAAINDGVGFEVAGTIGGDSTGASGSAAAIVVGATA